MKCPFLAHSRQTRDAEGLLRAKSGSGIFEETGFDRVYLKPAKNIGMFCHPVTDIWICSGNSYVYRLITTL